MLIQNVQRIIQGNETETVDILIHQGKIKAIGANLPTKGVDQVIDGQGHLVTPGLVDVHVHFREPGQTYKEDIKTGSQASARGGFTTVCAMANTDPVPDTPERIKHMYDLIKEKAEVKVYQYSTITEKLNTETITDYKALKEAGAVALSNDGLGIQTASVMYEAMKKAAEEGLIIAAHIEDASLMNKGVINAGPVAEKLGLPGVKKEAEVAQLARDLVLAESTGVAYHACHISTAESLRLIKYAKHDGVNVTVEASPHHLLLSDQDIPGDDGMWKMNPPLRSPEDRKALQEALINGEVDIIATDHAPHGTEEKQTGFMNAPFGIVGIETSFSLLYTEFVDSGKMTLEHLIDRMATRPAEIFGLPAGKLEVGQAADIAIFDIETEYEINPNDFLSKGKNTPFAGWKVKGETLLTLVDGQIVYQKENGIL